MKDILEDNRREDERTLNQDLSWEHETHNAFVDNCYECSKEEGNHSCNLCGDTGILEIYGGSTADDWAPVDSRPCRCQLEMLD